MTEEKKGKDGLIITVVMLATLMTTLDVSLVNISIPSIIKVWDITTSMAMWVLLAYALSFSSFLLLFGKLGERLGFRRVFSLGFIVFMLGTLLSALSADINTLIVIRFFQGIGAAMMASLAFASITRYVSPGKRGKGLGMVAAAGSLGAVIGPILGGWMTASFGFHSIFFVNLPIGLVALFLAMKCIPGDKVPAKARFDGVGAASIFLGLFSLIFALNMGQQLGWASPTILLCLVGAVVFIPAFILWELKKAKDPLLDMRLCRQRNVILPAMSSMTMMASFSGLFVIMPFYFEFIRGMNSASSGQMLLFATLTMVLAGLAAGALADRMSVRTLAIITLMLSAAAFLIMATISSSTDLLLIGAMFLLLGVGTGLFYPPSNKMIMASAPRDLMGEASGLLRTLQQVGSAVGVAIFTTILTSYVEVSRSATGFMDGMAACMVAGGVMVILGIFLLLLTKKPAPSAAPAPAAKKV
jgi:DHA2 family metal-tetracycline-proton antiporter-like MFS transporter